MKHYKIPELVAESFDEFGIDESKLTERDCVNEAAWELYKMEEWEEQGCEREQYGSSYAQYKRGLALYLARQRKRGIIPDGKYSYLDDPNKKR